MAAIIFDFDGTIADSFDFVAGFLAAEAKAPPLTGEERKELKNLSMLAMARRLGYSWIRLPRLFFRGRRQMRFVIKDLQPFDGIKTVIHKLHAEGHELFILSSNTVQNVHAFLHQHDLHTYFLEIYGGVGLFGKAPALRRLLREQNLEKENAIYVGDETRDVQAAQSINLRVIAVIWGFAQLSDLKTLRPTALADKPEDLISILEEL